MIWKKHLDCTKQKQACDATDSTRKILPLGLDNRNRKGNRGVPGEGGTQWQMAATSLHEDVLLDPQNVTSERPIVLMPTLIRWWEALRAPEVAKWQQKHRVEWDAADGRNGGAQQTM